MEDELLVKLLLLLLKNCLHSLMIFWATSFEIKSNSHNEQNSVSSPNCTFFLWILAHCYMQESSS